MLCATKDMISVARWRCRNPLRAKIVADLKALDGYGYGGHSVLMGRRRADWQDTDVRTEAVRGPYHAGPEVDALDLFELPYASPSKVGCFPVAVQRIFAIYFFRQSETSFLIFALIHFKAERINSSICFMRPLPFDYLCFTSVFVSWELCSDLNFRYRSHCSRRNSVSVPFGCAGFCLSSAVQIPSSRDKLYQLSVLPVFI